MTKQYSIHVVFSILIITIYSFIAYTPFILSLGFYNDDLLFGYIGHFYGPEGLINGFSGDRPLVGYLFAINNFLFNNNVLFWHLYMFAMRLLGGYILFFTLIKIWPNRLTLVTSMITLFLIFPGFLQQPVPLGYQNYITALTLWISSLFFTVSAVKIRNKNFFLFFTTIAVTQQITSFLLLEFFIGLESLRLMIIFHILKIELNFEKLRKNILQWMPYILGLTTFLFWRVFIFKSIREATDIGWVTKTYYSDPIWLAKIPLKIIYSFLSEVLFSYFIPLIVKISKLPVEFTLISFCIGILSSILIYLYYKFLSKSRLTQVIDKKNEGKKFGKNLFLIGVTSILITLTPIVISGRFVSVLSNNDNYDRYTISSIIGIVFVILGFLLFKIPEKLHTWLISLLIIFSVTTHIINGYWHVLNWTNQRNIWWQLYWRTPSVQKDALLIFDFPTDVKSNGSKDLLLTLYKTLRLEDYQIWAPGNLFFNHSNSIHNQFSGHYFISDNKTSQKLKNKTIEIIAQESSTFKYKKDFGKAIIISLPTEDSCLWVLDKNTEELPANTSNLGKSNIIYSNTGFLIEKKIQSINPPSIIFGKELEKGWCYYFQKASLARQLEDWMVLSKLTEEVLRNNLKPKDPNEWLPFIEGLIINKKEKELDNLISPILDKKPKMFVSNLCKMINRLQLLEYKKYCNKSPDIEDL